MPHHDNGNPADTRPGNLSWACKSCNTRIGKEHARLGIGRRTKQFNPGADNLAQYVQAAVDHTRGAHDAGGKIIHETPKGKRRVFAREIAFRKSHRNPKGKRSKKRNVSSAEELYRRFHGRGPDKSYDVMVPTIDPYREHPEIAQLGKLVHLYVGEGVKVETRKSTGDVARVVPVEEEYWCSKITFDDQRPDVAAEPGGRQIYFVGGNQNLDNKLKELGADPDKDILDLGFVYHLAYDTKKKFDAYQSTDYQHELGEETGVLPRLAYDRVHKLMLLIGGEYIITPRGIEN